MHFLESNTTWAEIGGLRLFPMPPLPANTPHEGEEPLRHEDLALIRAVLEGDDAARQFLADRTRIVPRVLAALNGRWGRPLTPQDIEDLSQDVVVFVLEKLESYQGFSPFNAWLYQFCSLQLRNRVRREIFRRKVVTDKEVEPEVSFDSSDQIDGASMWKLVEQLEPIDREILHAKHTRGLSFTEVATEMGAAPSSIKTRYYRSLDRIRLLSRQRGSEGDGS